MKKSEIETIQLEDDSPSDVAPKKNNISFRDADEAWPAWGVRWPQTSGHSLMPILFRHSFVERGTS